MFNGDRLRIARERRALTRKALAELILVSPRTITGWESNEYPPEDEKIDSLSFALDFPRSFFALDDSSKTLKGAVSFRSLTKKTAAQRDAVLAMCDVVIDVTKWIDERFKLPNVVLPDLRDEDPENAAAILRQEWGLGNRPIKNLLHLLEAKGVRIFSLSENCREIDACSFWSDDVPYILLNTEMSSERIRFDMAHELAHLVLHKHAGPSGRDAEKEANNFASSFLMPEDSIDNHRPRYWSIPILMQKKKIWNVSISALAYRAHTLKMLSEWQFKSINIELTRRGYKKEEPNSSPKEQSKVFEVILNRLREIGITLQYSANQMCLPESELRGLLYGLAKFSIPGNDAVLNRSEGKSHLRVIK